MTASPYRVLAVAASAEAVPRALELLGALPGDFPLAVALACERDPDERDALLRRVQAASRLPVCEPDDKDDFEGGRVYLAPASYHLVVDRDTVALACDPHPAPPAASVLFESAADSYGAAAAAALFCGEEAPAGAEEALATVRERGGLALRAQGPESIQTLLRELQARPGRKDDNVRRG